MQDFKLEIEVKVVAKPLSPKLGEEKRGPLERNQFVVVDKRSSHYVGAKGDVATLAANAAQVLARQWALSSSEPPQVVLDTASVYGTSITFRGQVNAHAVSTVVTVEYGLTTDLGTSVAVSQSPVVNSYWIPVNIGVGSLTAETNYYYRLKLVSAGVTIYTQIRRVKTKESGTTSTTTTSTTSTTTTTA